VTSKKLSHRCVAKRLLHRLDTAMETACDRLGLITPASIASWMNRIDEDGPDALLQLPVPVNEFLALVAFIVQRLKTFCAAMGRLNIAKRLATTCSGNAWTLRSGKWKAAWSMHGRERLPATGKESLHRDHAACGLRVFLSGAHDVDLVLSWWEIDEAKFLTAASHQIRHDFRRGFRVVQIDGLFVDAVQKYGSGAAVLAASGEPTHGFPEEGELYTGALCDCRVMGELITESASAIEARLP
jgi:hypothetical protein